MRSSAAAALCKSVQPRRLVVQKSPKQPPAPGGGCTVVRQGDVFCAIVDASALSQASQPAAVSGDPQVNPLFSRKMLPLTRAAADIRLRFLDGQTSWPAVDNDKENSP